MKKIKVRAGQIFAVKVAEDVYCFGQVMRKGGVCFYMAGFDLTVSSLDDFNQDKLNSAKVLFLGNFFDVLIKNGHWALVTEAPLRVVPYPCYRVMIDGDWVIESWDGSQKITLAEKDALRFPFRANHGAMLLEQALQNHFGYKESTPYLEKFMPEIDAEYVARIAAACPF